MDARRNSSGQDHTLNYLRYRETAMPSSALWPEEETRGHELASIGPLLVTRQNRVMSACQNGAITKSALALVMRKKSSSAESCGLNRLKISLRRQIMKKTIVATLAGLLALPAIAFAQIPQTPPAVPAGSPPNYAFDITKADIDMVLKTPPGGDR